MRRRHQRVQNILGGPCIRVSQLLELLSIALQSRVQLLVLSLQLQHLSLSVVLLVLALLELGLSSFNLLLDVREEQLLVQAMDLSNVIAASSSIILH